MLKKLINWIKNNREISLILLLGMILRLVFITRESFWHDEIMTALSMKLSLFEMVRERMAAGHSPLYFIIVYPFARLLGNNELILRLPSAIASIVSIYVFYLLAKKLFTDQKTVNISTLFFSMSALNIYFSYEARMYSFCVLFIILSFYYLLRSIDENYATLWVYYASSAAFAVYLSAVTIPVILSQAAYVIIRRKKWAAFLVSIASAAVLYVPMALYYLKMKKLGFIEWLDPVTIRTFTEFLNGFAFKPVPLAGWPLSYVSFMEYASLVAVLLILIGVIITFADAWKSRKIDDDPRAAIFLLAWLVVPIFIEYLYTIFKQPMLGPKRYIIVLSPAFYMLLGLAIKKISKERIRDLTTIVLIILFSVTLITFFNVQTREDWRGAISYIDKSMKPGEVLFGDISTATAYKYYGHNNDLVMLDIRQVYYGAFRNSWILIKEMDFKRIFGDDKALRKKYKVEHTDKFPRLRLYHIKIKGKS
jgi:4-amino-4-deoxy-L-arabinose transferase-like glycosyltransferase